MTQDQIEELAHRQCRRYIHIDTEAPYHFDGHTLKNFVRDILAQAARPAPHPDDCRCARCFYAAQPAQMPAQPRLTVRLTSFPESNGKRNWTALLVRTEKFDGLVGNCGGISLARGECWNRVAWEAECTRFLIGERDTEPFILDYGDDIETPDQWPGETHDRHRSRKGPTT